jgi:lipopolysaccharide transport system permease protein
MARGPQADAGCDDGRCLTVDRENIVSILLIQRKFTMISNNPHYSRHGEWRYLTDLIIQKAKAGLRAEASRGYLGVLWWIIEPVMYMCIFYIVFAHLFRRGDESFIVFLLTGLIAWKWFHTTVATGASSLIANVGLMNQVYLPKIVFPLTGIAVNTFKFIIILLILVLLLQFTPAKVTWAWTLLPVLVITQLLLIVAVTCLLAAIMPFFPDLRIILDNLLMMLLFLSGIFFDISRMPESVQKYFWLNPMAVVIGLYRRVLIEGLPPDWNQIFGIVSFSCIVMLLTGWIYYRFDRVFPKIIH